MAAKSKPAAAKSETRSAPAPKAEPKAKAPAKGAKKK